LKNRPYPGLLDPGGEPGVESPCVKICIYEPGAGLCLGCGRSLDEIAGWAAMSSAERRRIMAALAPRLAGLRKGPG
jgi:predicted Fe-S protein YdhL (DUF1289 family)